MNQKKINFLINIKPEPKKRPRFDPRSSRAYTPAETRRYEAALIWRLKRFMPKEPMTGPLRIHLHFYLEKPRTSKLKTPTSKPDLDNLIKAITDALNGIAYRDDAQITEIHASKHWGHFACIQGEITPLEDDA